MTAEVALSNPSSVTTLIIPRNTEDTQLNKREESNSTALLYMGEMLGQREAMCHVFLWDPASRGGYRQQKQATHTYVKSNPTPKGFFVFCFALLFSKAPSSTHL